ncbi:MAG: N-acetyl-gamma-glutamyl-phosphate reductase [Aquificae bacterium]|nr:N-acetyl-gamma-glutamyl-phosphate reductase [Aquificota bacterium]
MAFRVGIFGATGYTGLELVRILENHPGLEPVYLGSTSAAGKKLSDVFPFLAVSKYADLVLEDYDSYPELDLAFLALPHEVSMEKVPELLERGIKVVDLSGAYRFADGEAFRTFYGFEHRHPELLEEAVYGLPELFREKIRGARLVANPGCYPTATLLALYPLLKEDLLEEDTVVVNGLSGVSGAGRGLKQQFHFPEMVGNAFAYKVVGHRHTPEMEFVASLINPKGVKVRFTPAVIPIDRGMLSMVQVRVKRADLLELYRETYRNEPFVRVLNSPPHAKVPRDTNYCFVYPAYDERTGFAVVISAIDNLVKGASGQAVQNANLTLGLEETAGLTGRLPTLT